MCSRRSGAGVGVLDGILYAVGGHDGPLVPNAGNEVSVLSGYYGENSNAEGAIGYETRQSLGYRENIYETICNEPSASSNNDENIYESIKEVRQRRIDSQLDEPVYDLNIDQPSCSSTYGRIGNAYGRIDIIGHGIGRIERHLSSSCGSINSNHYAIESLYGTKDSTGRISKVSVQWLLANKWLPLWIANTETGRDYRIIDFLIAQGLERGEEEMRNEEDIDAGEETEGQQPPEGI
ncbi:hypothetical protein JTB14_030937 [Gonioctena quinquepunctata]|nr:hypothetical protein JTB14_030937 [Gonioctena quinquepunctata]